MCAGAHDHRVSLDVGLFVIGLLLFGKKYDKKGPLFPIFKINPAFVVSIVFTVFVRFLKKKQFMSHILVRSLKKSNFTRYKCLKKSQAAKLATLDFHTRTQCDANDQSN